VSRNCVPRSDSSACRNGTSENSNCFAFVSGRNVPATSSSQRASRIRISVLTRTLDLMSRFVVAAMFILIFSLSAHAACTGSSPTWTTTVDRASVQSCLDSAVDGDTINISAGSDTWTTAVSYTNKRLKILGPTCTLNAAGQPTACPVVISVNTGNSAIVATICSADDFMEIGHLEFVLLSVSNAGVIETNCTAANGYPAEAFRVHHVRMTGSPVSGGRWMLFYATYGLVDHVYLSSGTVGNISMAQDNTSSTCNSYHEPFALGDEYALFIEDSYLYSTGVNVGNGTQDHYMGARYVFRMNTVYNNHSGHHGLDSGNCGVPTFEYYGNTWISESGIPSVQLIHPRSGTGIVWGNKVQNNVNAANGYTSLLRPICYACMSDSEALGITNLGDLGLSARAARYYPTGTWGAPYTGTSNYDDGLGNYVKSNVLIDGNLNGSYPLGNMDSGLSRTVTDMVTTAGSTTITSTNADFVAGDVTGVPVTQAENFVAGRSLSCTVVSGDPTVVCAGGNFTAADDGREVSSLDQSTIVSPNVTTIDSITNSTTVELVNAPETTGTQVLVFADPRIVSISDEHTAVMNVPATANGTGKTLTIGYSNQRYPLADQPGWGYFASANAGLWPTQTSYSTANFEGLMPIYMVGNLWQTVNDSLVVQTSTNPPATAAFFTSTGGYLKADREWYDPYPNPAGAGIQTNATTPFNGTSGTGIGTIENIPTTCTAGVGYWAVNEGTWNSGSFTYTYPNGGSTYTHGRFYKCVATDDWDLFYTPFDYPHPLQGAVTLTSVSPDQGSQNTTAAVTLTGTGFDGGNFAVQITGSNVTINNIAGSGGTTRTADFVIAAGAATGDRSVTVSTDAGTSNAVTFTIVGSSAPVLTSFTPTQGVQGASYSFTVIGTGFDGGSGTLTESCTGLSLSGITVVSATRITATLTLASDASLAGCVIAVTTTGGTSNTEVFQPQALAQAGYGVGRTRRR